MLAELKVSYRRGRARKALRPEDGPILDVRSSERYLRSVWDKDTIDLREDFLLVCLNNAHEVLGWVKIASGGMNTANIDPRIIFGVALQAASSSIIVAHNHPSGGVPKPSAEDIAVTKRLREAGRLLGMRLLDHIILTRDGCYSFAESAEW